MGKPTGFKEYKRQTPVERPVEERIGVYSIVGGVPAKVISTRKEKKE